MKNKAITKNTKPFNNKQPTYFSWFFYISIFLIAVLCVNWLVTPDCNNNNDISPGSVFAPNNSSHNPYLIKKIKIIELPTQDENYNAKLFKEVIFYLFYADESCFVKCVIALQFIKGCSRQRTSHF